MQVGKPSSCKSYFDSLTPEERDEWKRAEDEFMEELRTKGVRILYSTDQEEETYGHSE